MSLRSKLSAIALAVSPIVIEGIDEDMQVRELTAGERNEFSLRFHKVKDSGAGIAQVHAWLIAVCLQSNGKAVYDPANKEDLNEIMAVKPSVTDLIIKAIFEVSGLTKQATEDAEKN